MTPKPYAYTWQVFCLFLPDGDTPIVHQPTNASEKTQLIGDGHRSYTWEGGKWQSGVKSQQIAIAPIFFLPTIMQERLPGPKM